jgi:two-component system, LytTR family, response regulator
MKAIIVDDEESARLTLKSILERYFMEVEVVDEASSASAALPLIIEKNPDLVFLDIQMGNESGFDVLEGHGQPQFPDYCGERRLWIIS